VIGVWRAKPRMRERRPRETAAVVQLAKRIERPMARRTTAVRSRSTRRRLNSVGSSRRRPMA
jgi:hypothetical protein